MEHHALLEKYCAGRRASRDVPRSVSFHPIMIGWVAYDTVPQEHVRNLGGSGGFILAGHRWRDYIETLPDDTVTYFEALRAAILSRQLKRGGDWHQSDPEGVPVFNDGAVAIFTKRAWGSLMAAVWAEHDARDYSYVNFYMDMDVERTVLWRSSPLRWVADDDNLESMPVLNSPAIGIEAGCPGASETRHIIPGSGRKTWFKDFEHGPEMVVVPAGEFLMGSPEGEVEFGALRNAEGPQHKVTIAKPFAVSRFPITFAQWDAAVAAGDVSHIPADEGLGRGCRPVKNVSWGDAKTYAAWLSTRTGKAYRLLTEAEWEYVARAGTTTPFWWGHVMPTRLTNYNFERTHDHDPSGQVRQRTVHVDGLSANPWGLFHVLGDVYEWCEDSWNDNYQGAPVDGSAWTGKDPGRRVVRGGPYTRVAQRSWTRHFKREVGMGFRVARTL